MNAGNLDTTNLLLGIMAAVSVLEALLLIGIGVMAYRLYGQAMQTIREVEQRQIAPLVARVNTLMARVDAILGDLRDVTARVSTRTERVDSAIQHTIDRVDETAWRVRARVSSRVNRAVAVFNAARAAIDGFFHPARRAPEDAPEHA
jgi:methyl-accepting chemotaxis protein